MVSTYDEYIAMVKAGNECQPTAYMSLHGNIAIVVCCAEVLFQSSFSLVSLKTLTTEHETSHALVVVWPHENGADTAQTKTERVLMRLVDTHLHDSRLYRAMKRVLRTIHVLIVSSCCLHTCCMHSSSWSTFGFTLRAR